MVTFLSCMYNVFSIPYTMECWTFFLQRSIRIAATANMCGNVYSVDIQTSWKERGISSYFKLYTHTS